MHAVIFTVTKAEVVSCGIQPCIVIPWPWWLQVLILDKITTWFFLHFMFSNCMMYQCYVLGGNWLQVSFLTVDKAQESGSRKVSSSHPRNRSKASHHRSCLSQTVRQSFQFYHTHQTILKLLFFFFSQLPPQLFYRNNNRSGANLIWTILYIWKHYVQ